jgi:hypothetical protein
MENVGMRREQHGVGDSWHAALGWVDGYTYGLLAEEWRERTAPGSEMAANLAATGVRGTVSRL